MEWIVGLNSLRLFAIILIFVYHLLRDSLPGGFVAVELFFVISGFLICSKLIAEYKREGKINYGKFLIHRLKRIYPPLLGCLAVTLLLALFLHPDLIAGMRSKLLAALTLTTNLQELFTGGNYENSFTPNLFEHLWFLGLDVQLCLLAPPVISLSLRIFGTRKKGIRALALVYLALALGSGLLMVLFGGVMGYTNRSYFAPDTHAMAFCIGGMIAALSHLRLAPPRFVGWRPLILAVLSALAIFIFATKAEYSDASTFLYVLPLVAMLSGIWLGSLLYFQANKKNQKQLSTILRPFEYLGGLSFGIYLYHWPILIVLPQLFTMNNVMSFTVCAILSVILAILAPLAIGKLSSQKRVRRIAFVALAILAICVCARAPKQSAIAESLDVATDSEIQTNKTTPDYLGYRKVMQESERVVLREFELASGAESLPSRNHVAAQSPNVAKVLVIGDSVTLGAKEAIEATIPSSFVDAKESRGIESAAPILAAYAMEGDLPPTIVVSLVTNERTITNELLQNIIDVGGAQRNYIFVNGYAGPKQPRENQNSALVAFAAQHANVTIADWWALAHDNWSLMYADHIHLNPEGRVVYADLIYNTIRRSKR
ncbi:acyltransferase [Candidatus Saccharibacteria bacterium]|nr:acyltransferase [Candidatus Saccharibacteria bacterium]